MKDYKTFSLFDVSGYHISPLFNFTANRYKVVVEPFKLKPATQSVSLVRKF